MVVTGVPNVGTRPGVPPLVNDADWVEYPERVVVTVTVEVPLAVTEINPVLLIVAVPPVAVTLQE